MNNKNIGVPQIDEVTTGNTYEYEPAWLNTSVVPGVPKVEEPVKPTPVVETPHVVISTPVEEEVVVEDTPTPLNLVADDSTDTHTTPIIQPTQSLIEELLVKTKEEETADTRLTPDKLRYTIPLSPRDDIMSAAIDRGIQIGPERFSEEISDPNTFAYACRTVREYFNPGVNFMDKILHDSGDKQKESNTLLTEIWTKNVQNIGVSTAKGIPSSVVKSKTISGKDALVTVASLMQGVKKVPLWNSGIYLTLRAPSIKELIKFYNSVNVEGYDFGREIGAFYFMYSDYKVKKLVLETLLVDCLVDSNYKHWKNHRRLLKTISIQDYDVILWALASMIYREGAPITLVCASSDCRYREDLLADLSKMRFVDTTKLTDEAIEFMKDTTVKTDNDLAKYHKLANFYRQFKFSVKNKATDEATYWCFDLSVANCYDYLEQGEALHNELLKENKANTEEEVGEFFSINHYRSFIPWIVNIRCISEEGYNEETVTDEHTLFTVNGSDISNKEVLNTILDLAQTENVGLVEYLHSFISDVKTTYICYYADKCTKCGKVPDYGINGFIPYDMQLHFFMMCLIRIWRTA